MDVRQLEALLAVAETGRQIYGTQFNASGEPHAIENEHEVDERREALGLCPMEDYKHFMKKTFAGW